VDVQARLGHPKAIDCVVAIARKAVADVRSA
jgi:hypothetical protein